MSVDAWLRSNLVANFVVGLDIELAELDGEGPFGGRRETQVRYSANMYIYYADILPS